MALYDRYPKDNVFLLNLSNSSIRAEYNAVNYVVIKYEYVLITQCVLILIIRVKPRIFIVAVTIDLILFDVFILLILSSN